MLNKQSPDCHDGLRSSETLLHGLNIVASCDISEPSVSYSMPILYFSGYSS
jgi:hypothetical protein